MLLRTLLVETLEKRRLFVADIPLANPADCLTPDLPLLANPEIAAFITPDETIPPDNIASLQVADAPLASHYRSLALSPTPEVFQGNSIALSEEFILFNRANFGANTSQLTLIQRSASEQPSISKQFELDFNVQSIRALHDHFVVMGYPFPSTEQRFPFFAYPQTTEIVIIDPQSGEFATSDIADGSATTRLSIPGDLLDIELFADGLAITTNPTLFSYPIDAATIDATGMGLSSPTQLGFLAYSESGFTWGAQALPGAALIEAAGSQLVAVTLQPDSTEPSAEWFGGTSTFIESWQRQGNSLVSINRTQATPSNSNWDFLGSASTTADGTHLLINRFQQSLVNDEEWTSDVILDWYRLDEAGVNLEESIKIPNASQVDTRLINDQLVILLDSQAKESIQILDLANPEAATLHTLPLSQPLQFQDHLLLDGRYLALFGHTQSLPLEEVITDDGTQTTTVTTYTNPSGAIAVIDLQDWVVSHEEILPENIIIADPYCISNSENKFTWHSMRLGETGLFTESRDVGYLSSSGSLEILEQIPLNTNWSVSARDDHSLISLNTESISQRELANPNVVSWTVPLEPLPEIIICEPFPEAKTEFETVTPTETTSLNTTNTNHRIDIDGDGIISPIDVLMLINHINRSVSGEEFASESEVSDELMSRLDIDGDTHVLPSDAIALITFFDQSYTEFISSDERWQSSLQYDEDQHFWNMLNSQVDFDFSEIDEVIESMIIETEAMLSFCEDDNWWNWFAPVDPIAKRITDLFDELENLDGTDGNPILITV